MAWTGNKKALCLGICQNWVNCDSATEVSGHVPHITTYRQNNLWVVHEIPAERLHVRCETSRLAGALNRDFWACARNVCQVLNMSPSVDLLSTCKVGQKFWVSLPLLTCSHSVWPSQLLYHRCQKSWRDLWITLFERFFMKPVSVVKKDLIVPLKLLLYWMFLTIFLWFDVLDGQKAEIWTTQYYKTIEIQSWSEYILLFLILCFKKLCFHIVVYCIKLYEISQKHELICTFI
jgi:hypothetical protein